MKKVFQIMELGHNGQWFARFGEWDSYDEAEKFTARLSTGRYKIEMIYIVEDEANY